MIFNDTLWKLPKIGHNLYQDYIITCFSQKKKIAWNFESVEKTYNGGRETEVISEIETIL